MGKLKLGKYKHYKGKFYEVIGISRDRETLEELVVYRALYDSEEFGENSLWVRPKKVFMATVNVDGKEVSRFRYVGDVRIEVEVRSFISKEKYEELLEFFKENARLVEEGFQDTHYYDSNRILRTQKNKSGGKVCFKKGDIHDNQREEIEINFNGDNDFDKMNNILGNIGFGVQSKWFRERKEYDWKEIRVCLDNTKGYGYIIELERMMEVGLASKDAEGDKNKEEVLKLLRDKLLELGVEETSKEEFNKKYDYYNNNWRELVDDTIN